MSTNTDHQDTIIPKVVTTPAELAESVRLVGYDLRAFLAVCGVKYNTFQHWKRIGRIPNKSALMLANYIIRKPDQYMSFWAIESTLEFANDQA